MKNFPHSTNSYRKLWTGREIHSAINKDLQMGSEKAGTYWKGKTGETRYKSEIHIRVGARKGKQEKRQEINQSVVTGESTLKKTKTSYLTIKLEFQL